MATLFLLGYNLKICYLVGGSNLWWEEGTKIWCVCGGGESFGRRVFPGGGNEQIVGWWRVVLPLHPPVEEKLLLKMQI